MGNFNQILLEAIKIGLAAIVGGLIGARANDILTRRRERDSGIANRKREFRAFMAQLCAEAKRPRGDFAEFYLNKVPNLQHAANLIIADFSRDKRGKFNDLVNVASSYNGAQASNHIGIKSILESFEAIISFVDSN